MKLMIEMCGWYGAIAILAAYILVSFSIIQPTDVMYQLLNATGALGIVAVSIYKQVYQPAVLNMVWAFIACTALFKVLF